MPKRLLKNPAAYVAVGAVAIFWICARFFTADQMSDATATVMAILCALGLWRWGPAGWRVFWKGARRTEDWGILAVCLLLLAILTGRIYGIIYRQLDRPDWLTESYWGPFFLYMLLGAVALIVAATKDDPPHPPAT